MATAILIEELRSYTYKCSKCEFPSNFTEGQLMHKSFRAVCPYCNNVMKIPLPEHIKLAHQKEKEDKVNPKKQELISLLKESGFGLSQIQSLIKKFYNENISVSDMFEIIMREAI